MKKTTLLLCLFLASVLMPQLAVADSTVVNATNLKITIDGTSLKIESSAAGALKSFMEDTSNSGMIASMKSCKSLVLVGVFSATNNGSKNSPDLQTIKKNGSDFDFTSVDMSLANFLNSATSYWTNENVWPNYAEEGAKCYVGSLFQLSITTSKEWIGCDPFETNDYEGTSLPDVNNYQAGNHAKINKYRYYRLNVENVNSWVGPSPSVNNGNLVSSENISEDNLPDASGYNVGDYMRFEQPRKYYQLVPKLQWQNDNGGTVDQNTQEIPSDWDPNNPNSWPTEGYSYNDKLKKTYEYYVQYFILGYDNDKSKWEWVEIPEPSNDVISNAVLENNKNNKNYSAYAYIYEESYHYYQVQTTQVKGWDGPSDSPVGNPIIEIPSFTEAQREENTDYNTDQGVRFLASTEYYVVQENQTRTWNTANSATNHVEHFFNTTDERDADTQAVDGDYAMVGTPTEFVRSNGQWVLSSGSVEYDKEQIKFTYWDNLQIIVLPEDILSSDLLSSNLWGDNNKNSLTEIHRGETYAEITRENNNRYATIHTNSDDEFAILKSIVTLDNLLQESNVTQDTQDEPDGDYIRYNETTGVYDVLVTSEGKFTTLFNKGSYPEDAVFHFESGCRDISADDLVLLSSTSYNGKYYIDLYDIVTSEDFENNVIKAAINKMADSSKDLTRCRGLLLPKNPTTVGTMQICNGSDNVNQGFYTCGEFIAYHNQSTTMAHVFYKAPQNDFNGGELNYEQRLAKLKSIMDNHNIAGETSKYGISTNKKTEIANIGDIINDADATIIHTYNNELVNAPTHPTVVATLKQGDDFTNAFSLTGISNTPNIERLILNGPVSDGDITTINSITNNGPRVLDLSGVTSEITNSLLSKLDNDYIQYIILPAGMDESLVCDYDHEKLPKLKCVISSNKSSDEATDKVLTAYVRTAGSLAEARCFATGHIDNKPTAQGLTAINLSGNLNASDIGAKEDGQAFKGEKATVTSINLEKAYFATASDMVLGNGNFSGNANETNLKVVKLPTNENMTEIPANCLNGISTLTDLHIPYNYKKIGWQAFWETGINHITTEDANHVLIDNGEHTYTLSANIEELGEAGHIESTAVFPQKQKVHDVYCLATKVPTCYAHTFHSDIVYGHGGANAGPYCKEKYHGDEKVIALLHFPSEDSYNSDKNKDKESTYADLEKKYTDPTRAYTKKDQTGAVDANGKPMLWPDQSELKTSRDMALDGYIWADYDYNYPAAGHLESATLKNGAVKNGNFDSKYAGWHEFILSQATHVDPTEIVTEEKVIERKYVDAGWYTICLPYNLTRSQVLKMMGVPASTAKVKNYLVSKDATTNEIISTEVDEDMMPDIRQLKSVTRKKKGEGESQNQVKFFLTQNLYGYKTDQPTHTYYLNFNEISDNKTEVKEVDANGLNDYNNSNDPMCLVGGRPYIIKIYKREDETISQQNIGKYILTRYGDELGLSASCLENGPDYYEQLLDENASTKDGLVTLQFVKPYEKHLVQALTDDGLATPITYTENGKTYRYYYTMQGQFWDQDLPEYCFYISKSKWFHYMDKTKNYKWNAYKCVIMATPLEVAMESPVKPANAGAVVAKQEIDDNIKVIGDIAEENKPTVRAEIEKGKDGALNWESHWGVGFRWYPFCWFPQPDEGTQDKLGSHFRLGFMGRNDDDFNVWGMARYIFDYDGDSVLEYDEDGNETTAIDMLGGEAQPTGKSYKVYSISGQYMGTTTENLPKGIYVVGGRKIVVN